MSERDKKDHGEDSAKQVTSRWFARHSLVDIRDVKLYHPDVLFAEFISPSSRVTFSYFWLV